jgi:hypothetical protein
MFLFPNKDISGVLGTLLSTEDPISIQPEHTYTGFIITSFITRPAIADTNPIN